MATDLKQRAMDAFVDDHLELAVDLYSQAIAISPKNAELFADRAQANIKLKNPTEAVSDANKAIELDPSMSKAYLRKATACMELEEYQTAKEALEMGASLVPGDSRFTNLIKKCDQRIAEETCDLKKQVSEKAPTEVISEKEVQPVKSVSSEGTVVAAAKPKYRHEFYQKPAEVVVTIFAKGIPAKNVTVVFGEQILSVTIDVPGDEVYQFQCRLFGKILPTKCRYEVLSTKVEIRLAKAEQIHWTSLEFSQQSTERRVNVSSASHTGPGPQRPAYPSSKPASVDWDKLDAQLRKEEKEEKLDGDAALNKFFRDIYADADEDTRRAMKKSFVESNGTVLSTNWKEVGTKKVEGSPPDGMEMKKWEI